MARGPESRLQTKIQKALQKEFPRSFFFKTHGGPYQRAGIPDIIGSVEGSFIGIEVKVPGRENTLTDLQQHTIDQINESGGLAFMSTNPEDAIDRIKKFL